MVQSDKKLTEIARQVKLTTLDISYSANTGHIGSAFSIIEILTSVYFGTTNIDSKNFKSKDRDYFILSKGHAAAALYAALFHKGILSKKQLASFGKDYGLCEHPEIHTPGVDMSTGSLGHGISYGMGLALSIKKQSKKNSVYVLISDGESNEGGIWEAALLAPKLELSNLTVIVDNNGWQCFGPTQEITSLLPLKEKWESFGWETLEVDGHNIPQLKKVLKKPAKKPKVIIANTTAGYGISLFENQLVAHYKALTKEEYEITRKEISK